MTDIPHPTARRLARIASLPLALAPREFRSEYRAELVGTFALALAEERRARGRRAMASLWLRGLGDALRAAWRERRLTTRSPRGPVRGLNGDVRVAWRSWRRAPALPASVVLTLTLGLGLASAIFAFADGYLFRPLPFRDPDQLHMVLDPKATPSVLRASDAAALRDSVVARFGFVEWDVESDLPGRGELIVDGRRVPYVASAVSPGFVETLGVPLATGRWFTPDEYRAVSPVAVCLSYRFWQREFGGSVSVIGRTLTAENASGSVPLRVVGIMAREVTSFDLNNPPPDIVGPGRLPTVFRPTMLAFPIVRLPAGMTLEVGTEAIAAALQRAAPSPPGETREVLLRPLRAIQVSGGRPTAQVFFVGALLVLLLVTANLAHLGLTRAVARQAEFDTRAALGASRWRLARALAVDSLALGAAGILGGLLLGVWLSRLIAAVVPMYPTGGRNLALVAMVFDARVVAFAAVLGVLVVLLGAAWPLWRVARRPLTAASRSAGGTSSAMPVTWSRSVLSCEVAVATVIMAGSVFMGLGVWRYLNQPLGFDYEDRFAVFLEATPAAEDRQADWAETVRVLQGTPGVRAAAVRQPEVIGEVTEPANPTGEGRFMAGTVDREYFAAWGIDVIRGRGFRPEEFENDVPVAIVNAQLAGLVWPDRDPIGQRVRVGDGPVREIVGLVRGQRWQIETDPWPMAFVPRPAVDSRETLVAWAPGLTAGELTARLQNPMSEVAPGRRVVVVEQSFDRLFQRGSGEAQFQRPIVIVFGLFAFAVAGIGLFGLVSYLTSQRTRDFGIRIALGARPGHLWQSVVRESLIPAVVGLAAGLVAAALLEDLVRASVFGWESSGPIAIAIVAAALLAVAMAAAVGPARRVLRIDPVVALRHE